jgi:hypothetical protein
MIVEKQISGTLDFTPFHDIGELFYCYCLCMLPVRIQTFHTAPRLDSFHDIENGGSTRRTASGKRQIA